MTTRQEREREFHDRAFGEGTRRSADRFYSIERQSKEFYLDQLSRRCQDEEVLEYGCGPGSAAFFLAEHGARVTGIDISPVAIETATEESVARGLDDRLRFEVMDAEQLRFDNDSFGLVCGTGILHHLDLDRAYPEIARVLRPGGHAIFVEPLGHNPAINLYRRRTPSLRTEDEHPLLVADLERASRHFGHVDPRFFHLFTLLAVPMRNRSRFDDIVALLGRFDDALFRLVPPSRRHAWLVALILGEPRDASRGASVAEG